MVGDGTVADGNSTKKYFAFPGNAEIGDCIDFFYLYPSALADSKSYFVTNASETIILPGGGSVGNSSTHQITQANTGRRKHTFLYTGTNKWTLHRTM